MTSVISHILLYTGIFPDVALQPLPPQHNVQAICSVTSEESVLACADADGKLAAMAAVQHTDSRSGKISGQFMVYLTG